MNIASTQYTASTKSLDIYVSGCKAPHCSGCHNSELFNFDIGRPLDNIYLNEIISKVRDFDKLIENIFMYGGEPLDQEIEILKKLLSSLKHYLSDKKIWLFTKYRLEYVPCTIKMHCDYIKCGRYLEEFRTDTLELEERKMYGVKLSTLNQVIYKKGKDY